MINYIKNFLDVDCSSINRLDELKDQLGIFYSITDNLVILSYSQIDSPKTDRIVRMCRGIVLEKDTWNIVSMPFYRFYNFEEVPEEREKFNWDKSVATTKIDGSLISLFNYNNKWYISSRSKIGGENKVGDNIHTFIDLFKMAISPLTFDQFTSYLNPDYCYTFELVSPFNRIVTEYKETKIYLIGCRDRLNDFNEIQFKDVYDKFDQKLKDIILIPEIIPLVNEKGEFRGFEDMKAMANGLNQMDEGFVVTDFSHLVDGNFPRTKVKNSAYVALHHLRGTLENGSITYHNILNIVYKNEVDEVCASLPHYANIIRDVQKKYNNWIDDFNKEINTIKEYFTMENINDPAIKKEFALKIKDMKYNKIYFSMLKLHSIDIRSHIDMLLSTKASDTVFKSLWEMYVSKF